MGMNIGLFLSIEGGENVDVKTSEWLEAENKEPHVEQVHDLHSLLSVLRTIK
jgi:hypothetical protein